MRLAFLLTMPSTVGLMMLAEPIISVLYQHGRFDAHQTAEAAGALRFYAIGLCGYAALKVLVNAFYALDRRKTPMLVSFMAVALNLLFNWIFTFHLGWGHRGLAFSTGCVATFNFLVLYGLMRHQPRAPRDAAHAGHAGQGGGWRPRHWRRSAGRHSTGCWREWATQGFVSKLGALLLTVVAGVLVFLGCGAALRIEELAALTGCCGAVAARRVIAAVTACCRPPRPCRTRCARRYRISSRQIELKRPTSLPL